MVKSQLVYRAVASCDTSRHGNDGALGDVGSEWVLVVRHAVCCVKGRVARSIEKGHQVGIHVVSHDKEGDHDCKPDPVGAVLPLGDDS